ncbi:thioredoxin-like protein [Apiospora arundinis]
MENTNPVKCTLYCFPFSLYSIMVRYLIQLAKRSADSRDIASSALNMHEQILDLHHDENIDEWYLLTVNRKGQVPSMVIEGTAAPITDSLDISYWLCGMFPQLLPRQHEATIRRLLRDLHAIEGISVSIRRRDGPEEDLIDPCVDDMLARNDLSPEYRQALEAKKGFDDTHVPKSLHHVNVDRAEQQTAALLAEVASLYEQHGRPGSSISTWLLGEEVGPTVLDAQVLPFVTRVEDAGRSRLVPEVLLQYAAARRASPEWDVVMGGKDTVWRKKYGQVRDAYDMSADLPPATTLLVPRRPSGLA